MSREDDIQYYLTGDRIWPPTTSKVRPRFERVLREVLKRLSDDIFDRVTSTLEGMWFILDIRAFGINVPLRPSMPVSKSARDAIRAGKETQLVECRADQVIIFERAFNHLNDTALIGLVVHEIAHSFVRDSQGVDAHRETEERANGLAIQWGFQEELQELENALSALRT